MSLVDILKRGTDLASQNSTALLTGVGVVGTVTTAVLTGKASIKAYQVLEDYESSAEINQYQVTFKDKLHVTWTYFIPPVGVGLLTVSAIVFANRLSAREATALAAAYGISERAFDEYRTKVVEKLGVSKETGVRDEIAADRIAKATSSDLVVIGDGKVPCLDMFTGRYFESSMEALKKAENDTNYEIINHMYASLSTYYDKLGLEATEVSDELGWNSMNPLEVSYSSQLAANGKPCIAISFAERPVMGYNKLYN